MKRNVLIIITALVSLAIGAGVVLLLVRRGVLQLTPAAVAPSSPTTMAMPTPSPAPSAPAEVVVSIPPDALERMHLSYGTVTEEVGSVELRVPGTVQPNGYREVRVTPLVGGIVTKVQAELGQTVKPGQVLATLFSRELAEAQSEFVGFQAQLEAEHKKLVRTQELLNLGAASRQEFEDVEASHQMHTAHLEEARQRLLLFGLSEDQVEDVRVGRKVSSEIAVPAPIDGIVTARSLNLGQVVSIGQELFTVTDLSSVWVEGNVLEDDFATVLKGSKATMTSTAYPGRTYQGTVDYVDPRVDPQTRTAKVRVIVENRDLALRLGMYMNILFAQAGAQVRVVPARAVQMIGESSVVYTPIEEQPGQFRQHIVTVGTDTAAGRQITGDLNPSQRVVTEGSFLLRAEALRQHLQ